MQNFKKTRAKSEPKQKSENENSVYPPRGTFDASRLGGAHVFFLRKSPFFLVVFVGKFWTLAHTHFVEVMIAIYRQTAIV
jgi:hypothetical protein